MLVEKIVRHPRVSLIAAIIILVVVGGVVWWNFSWQSPENVFNGMLANNLSTSSVTKEANASSNGQSVDQTVRLQMGSTNAADWLVSADSAGSAVTTDSIGTPTTGYIRYTHIDTAQKNKSGKPYDFSSILNVWGKEDAKSGTSLDQLFTESLLDVSNAPVPPIGNLSAADRQTILGYMNSQKVFAPSYKNVKSATVNGRSVYTYQVSVKLGAYVRMMQAFAHDLGMHNLDTIDPDQYSTAQPITMSMSVDKVSHQLVKVSYADSGFSQSYSDWGLTTPITLPTKSIPASQLQSRIQAAE